MLTRRQGEILRMFASGDTIGDIAEKLCLSKKTVDAHRTRMMRTTGARTSLEMILSAVRNGSIPLEALAGFDLPVYLQEAE